MSTIYRERTLNQISEADVDSHLRVAGWVENIRDHGGVDMGNPIWAMHSACETGSVDDHLYCIKAVTRFYEMV